MPHITAAIPLNDGLSTPVARSFAPQLMGMDLSRFAYKKGVPKFTWVFLDVKWSDSTPKRPTVRQEVATEFPIIRNIGGVDTKVSVGRAITTFIIPDEMTDDEIKDLRAFQLSALSHGAVTSGILGREPIWG